jgi:Putative prokaryotic signal transducing protein
MAKLGPEATRKRLAEHYASLTEEELRELADDGWSLTDVAREILKAEVSRRGLTFEVREAPLQDSEHPRLVTLRQFRDLPEALLARSILDSAGIDCFLQDENTIRLDWLWSNAMGGVKLLVKEEDASDAANLLDQKPLESFHLTPGDEYIQPRCPVCGSVNISFGEKGKRLSYVTVAVGVPLPVKRSGWKCHSCGYQWDEMPDAPDAETKT